MAAVVQRAIRLDWHLEPSPQVREGMRAPVAGIRQTV
jgi:hypothetical protein